MSWLEKIFSKSKRVSSVRRDFPDGVWGKCSHCNGYLYLKDFNENLNVCTYCSHHEDIQPRVRLKRFLDENTLHEVAANITSIDILKFKDKKKYKDRIIEAKKKTGEEEALVVFEGKLFDNKVVVCSFNFAFIGGSLSAAVGDKFIFACKKAIENQSPLICFSASGGARMQESMLSLMQMWRTSFMLAELSKNSIPFISVLTNPTFGGVSASLASLGDINIAEPDALIGFAGPRVIKQTVGEDLPEGFQTSEYLLKKGMLDMVVDRRKLRFQIFSLLDNLFFSAKANNDNSNMYFVKKIEQRDVC